MSIFSPNGKFLYTTSDAISILKPILMEHSNGRHVSTLGKGPRNFAIDPTGLLLVASIPNDYFH
jgi:6-phosphogluconolactonase